MTNSQSFRRNTYTLREVFVASVVLSALLAACSSPRDLPRTPRPGKTWLLPLAGTPPSEMIWIPSGSFTMGSPPSETGRKPGESPTTHVTLTRGFWLGRTMVTIAQWKSVTGLDARGQLTKMLHDDTLYDLGGKKQTVRDYMRFSRNADPGQYLANEQGDLPMYFVS